MQVRQTGRDKGIGRGSGFARSLFPDKKRTGGNKWKDILNMPKKHCDMICFLLKIRKRGIRFWYGCREKRGMKRRMKRRKAI